MSCHLLITITLLSLHSHGQYLVLVGVHSFRIGRAQEILPRVHVPGWMQLTYRGFGQRSFPFIPSFVPQQTEMSACSVRPSLQRLAYKRGGVHNLSSILPLILNSRPSDETPEVTVQLAGGT